VPPPFMPSEVSAVAPFMPGQGLSSSGASGQLTPPRPPAGRPPGFALGTGELPFVPPPLPIPSVAPPPLFQPPLYPPPPFRPPDVAAPPPFVPTGLHYPPPAAAEQIPPPPLGGPPPFLMRPPPFRPP
jgi:hypothetical protein